METTESQESGANNKLLTHDNSLSSYGVFKETVTVDTPTRKYRFRIWTVSFSCAAAIQAWFIYGYSLGYTSPVLNDLSTINSTSTYTSLRKIAYQDTFSVRHIMVL